MMMNAIAEATAWVAIAASAGGQPGEAALDQPGQRRLADPAEARGRRG